LINVALARGKYKKGGIPDLDEAARVIIKDWTAGKLPYYVIPPGFNYNLLSNLEED
jgi:nuclear GTP-binding protein